MDRKRRSTVGMAVPALSLLLGSSLLVSGAQMPVERDFTRIWAEDAAPEPSDGELLPLRETGYADCAFVNDPARFIEDKELRNAVRSQAMGRVVEWMVTIDASSVGADPNSIPRRNFIDEEIFGRMASAGIQSAPVVGDAEFLRRVTLDLTGRIPSADDVRRFLADPSSSKRDTLVDTLIAGPEFTDKWTLFFGDLFQVNAASSQVQRQIQGRDAFYLYLRDAVQRNKPYDRIAREMIAAAGDGYVVGEANWPIGNTVPMGPAQDTYDGAAVDLASMFMGVNTVDCLLCHDGAGHLEQVNVWASTQTRQNMWGLAAYFSRTRMRRTDTSGGIVVSDVPNGGYNLNTTFGNRSPRQPVGGVGTVAPQYPFAASATPGGGILQGETYRQAIARQITADPQFARAAVNYIWERMMGEAFVSPSNAFDLARLDPNNPPPAPWTLQPTNPQLLERMAEFFRSTGHDIRALIGAIAKSSAYQLSASYPGTWDPSYVPFYARKYVRRLDSEEIADALVKASGTVQSYTFREPSVLPAVQWAGQLPDTAEPRNDGGVRVFLDAFGRGDRDLNPRRSDGSVLQALTMMNNAFVTNRIRRTGSTTRVAQLLQQSSDPDFIIRELYLHTLSRPAADEEVQALLPTFQQQGLFAATESLQWVLFNKLEFLFNY